MTDEHTPGPWTRTQSGNGDWFKSPHSPYGKDYPIPSSGANFDLMAAAPEMLAALEALVAGNFGQPYAVSVPALDPARAIIAKARGRSA